MSLETPAPLAPITGEALIGHVDAVRSQTQLPREQVMASFLATFRRLYYVVDGELTPDELAEVRRP